MTDRQTLSVIIPMYNEEASIAKLYAGVMSTISKLPGHFEIIFVDDGSRDNTLKILESLIGDDSRVHVIELTRNFGKEVALTAGLNACKGDAAIMLDADLQHPPEIIPQFIAKWRDGVEVVIGVRNPSKNTTRWHKFNSWAFYRILNSMSQTKIVPRSTDFRLLDRAVIDEFNLLTEHNRMTRGLIDWLGFKCDYLAFDSPERCNGEASYGLMMQIRLAVNSMVGLTLLPLRLAGYLGVVITIASGLFGLLILIDQQILNDPLGLNITGPVKIADVNMFLIGIVLMSLGLMALYIGSIHAEVLNRPLYVVRKGRRK